MQYRELAERTHHHETVYRLPWPPCHSHRRYAGGDYGGRKGWTQSTPSIWLPDNHGYQCDYMAKRVHIKHKYNLTMSAWEKDETIAFLTQCATQ